MHRLHLSIEGRVQGVGFRYFVMRSARRLGLHGRVRNLPDGAVEVDAEGDRAALERLAADARQGPSGANVSNVHENWSEGPAHYREFTIG